MCSRRACRCPAFSDESNEWIDDFDRASRASKRRDLFIENGFLHTASALRAQTRVHSASLQRSALPAGAVRISRAGAYARSEEHPGKPYRSIPMAHLLPGSGPDPVQVLRIAGAVKGAGTSATCPACGWSNGGLGVAPRKQRRLNSRPSGPGSLRPGGHRAARKSNCIGAPIPGCSSHRPISREP